MTAKRKGKRAPARPATPAKTYPPGWFTEPCRAWVQLKHEGSVTLPRPTAVPMEQLAQKARRKAQADGGGWGAGTIVLPNTPKHTAPAWMPRPRTGG